MKSIPLLLTVSLGVCVNAFAQYDLSLTQGYDSNPNKLNEQHPFNSAYYNEVDLEAELALDSGWFAKMGLKNTYVNQKQATPDAAYQLDIGYLTKLGSNRVKLAYEFDYRNNTFISKTTGQMAEFANESIEDRYDYAQHRLLISTRTNINKKLKSKTQASVKQKNYVEYASLTSKDYLQTTLSQSFDFYPSKKQKYSLDVDWTNQDFLAANDPMKISGFGVDLAARYKVTKNLMAYTSLDYGYKFDNQLGEDNNSKIKFSAQLKQKWQNYWIALEFLAQKSEYMNRTALAVDNDELVNSQKNRLTVDVGRDVKFGAGKLESTLFLMMQSNNADYQIYQYQQFKTGLALSYGQ